MTKSFQIWNVDCFCIVKDDCIKKIEKNFHMCPHSEVLAININFCRLIISKVEFFQNFLLLFNIKVVSYNTVQNFNLYSLQNILGYCNGFSFFFFSTVSAISGPRCNAKITRELKIITCPLLLDRFAPEVYFFTFKSTELP